MTQWLYYSLIVFSPLANGLKQEKGKWYVPYSYDREHATKLLPLNPQRDWTAFDFMDNFALDDAGYADFAREVISKLGSDGWELAAIDSGSTGKSPSRYVFKKSQP